MPEMLVSVVLEQLASILMQQVETDVKLVVGVEGDVQKLTSNFQAIAAVIEDAENRQVKEKSVRDWLDKLTETSYDIQDVLDKWSTAIRKLHMKKIGNASKFKKKVRSLIPAYRFSPKQIILRFDIAIEIKDLNKTLDNIAKEKDMFSFSLTKTTQKLERQTTTSVLDLSKVSGRYQDKDEIVDLLLSESGHGVASLPIISIVGMGGIGKTTLARLVYHDDRVSTHFDKKIWVCVSDPFDEIRIARAILESLQGVASSLVEFETLLQKIGKIIATKRFLLVLDDVWTEDPNKWEQLKNSLVCGSQGSRVLLTTRKENVAKIMGTNNMISLGRLPNEECWSLFSQVAFSGRSTKEYEKLEGIGRKIVSKCNGLPLASLLSLKEGFEQWQSVLDSEIWKLEEIEMRLFPPLLLSYYDLSTNLRKCFSYCAIFPKDYPIKKGKLIKLWMAQGYLKVEGTEDMELVGREYFQNLAMRSFFQDFETNPIDGEIRSCRMHDIVHDFAQFLTKNECLTIEVDDPLASDQLESASHKAPHAMIRLSRDGSFPISVLNVTKLRSLVIECYNDDLLTSDILSELFDKLTCLRAICLSSPRPFESIEKVSSKIGKLIHLRYLALKNFSNIKELPKALCGLYNLQTLDISFCICLEKLPEGLGKLINLSHFLNICTPSLSYLPKGMERLSNLRILREFPVSGTGHGSNTCTLECLKNLNDLRGSLQIRGIGNVADINEVKSADLKRKKNLLDLGLSFDKEEGEGRVNVGNEVVLEALQPPPNLEKLEISVYESKTLATHWLLSLSNLKILKLCFCRKLVRLPPLGNLSSLESLYISGVESLNRLGNEFLGIQRDETFSSSSPFVAFPKLKSLEFREIDELEEWDYELLEEEDVIIMPCLHSLKFYGCPKLEALPDHILRSTTLEKVGIYGCINLQKRYKKGKGEDWHKISHIPYVLIVY